MFFESFWFFFWIFWSILLPHLIFIKMSFFSMFFLIQTYIYVLCVFSHWNFSPITCQQLKTAIECIYTECEGITLYYCLNSTKNVNVKICGIKINWVLVFLFLACKTVVSPFGNKFQMVVNRWVPLFAAIVDCWQITTVVGWQVWCADVLQQWFTIFSMEEHLET